MRSIVVILMAITLLVGCSSDSPVGVEPATSPSTGRVEQLSSGQLTPFQGSWVSLPGPPAGPGVISLTGHGVATKIGKNTFTSQLTVDPLTGVQVGSTTLTAANGDELTFDFVGISFPPDAEGNLVFSGDWTFVSGTGHFVDVSGSGTYEGSFNLVLGEGMVSQVGTIGW